MPRLQKATATAPVAVAAVNQPPAAEVAPAHTSVPAAEFAVPDLHYGAVVFGCQSAALLVVVAAGATVSGLAAVWALHCRNPERTAISTLD